MTPLAKQYALRILDAFETGNDWQVVSIKRELQEHAELFSEVWGYLPSTMRRQIKEICDREGK